MNRTAHAVRALVSVLVLGLLAGCSQPAPWHLKDVSGLLPDLQFQLTRARDGKTVTAADYRGKVVALYFGYTNCADVCPIMMGEFAAALQSIGDRADDVRVLFVSVDPKRDTRQRLAQYASAFGDAFVGLRGDMSTLREVTKRYRTTFGYGKPDDNGFYEVSHSTAAFIFDRKGNVRLLAQQDAPVGDIAADLTRLVQE